VNRRSAEDVVLEFVDPINRQDPDALAQRMTEDFIFIDMSGDLAARGRAEIGWGDYFSAYPDYKIHVSKVLRSGDAVAIVGTTTGSHVPPEIEAHETVLWTATVREGLVADWRIYSDIERVKEALAAEPGTRQP
jgi:ketosteroid isomerase-like protein